MSAGAYLLIIAVLLLIAISAFLFLKQQSGSPGVVAVINKTNGKVLWIGGGALCIPAVNNTYIAPCSSLRGNVYNCNGIIVNQSNVTNIPC